MGLMASFLTAQPYMAGLVGVIFLALGYWRKSRMSLVTALLWLGYALYEYAMMQRLLCHGDCNIRIDLLFIYPLLIGLSLYAIIQFSTAKPISS